MKSNILMIVYFFDPKEGVGSLRSITLNKFLNEKGISTKVIQKNTFGEFIKKNFFFWSLIVFLKILFSKEKKVYVSCGPFQHLLFVAVASFVSRKKLVVDFRDPWSLNIKRGYNHTVEVNRAKLTMAIFIEKWTYRICETFIVCTQGMYNEYEDLFKDQKKLLLMTNGYDFEPSMSVKEVDLSNLEIVCLGKFAEYDMEKAIAVLKKVKSLATNTENIKIHFIGSAKTSNMQALEKVDLVKNSIFYPRMKYERALEIAAKCNLSMLMLRDEDIEYGTKVFDYIGLGIPVLDSFDKNSIFKKEFHKYIFNGNSFALHNEEQFQYNRKYIYNKNLKRIIIESIS